MPPSDPLACLEDQQAAFPGLLLAAAGEPAADGAQQLVLSDDARQQLAVLAPWLSQQQPVLLVGPEGCGKSTLLRHCFSRLRGVTVATVHCSVQTAAAHVIQKLVQVRGWRLPALWVKQ